MKLHLIYDIDETITLTHVYGADDVSPDNIKGGNRLGDLLNRSVAEGHHNTIASYNKQEILLNKTLQYAGVTAENLQKFAMLFFKPFAHKVLGKNLHCEQACEIHGISLETTIHVLFDDNQLNCNLFRKRGGVAFLVNGDETHLDALRAILDRPQDVFKIAEVYKEKAEQKRILEETLRR